MNRRHGKHSRGQAMLETALILPFILVLLGGAAQIATIASARMSTATAAMEGARVASESPNKSLDFAETLSASSYVCGQELADAATEGSVCDAVRSSTGLLGSPGLTITVSVTPTISRAPGRVYLAKSKVCPSSVQETGTVSALPAGVVATVSSPSAATAGTVTTSSAGDYAICLSKPSGGQGDQATMITATATDGAGCVYSASVNVVITTSGAVSPSPAQMTLGTGACPTPAPTPQPTPTPTPTPLPTPTTSPGAPPTPPAAGGCVSVVPDTQWATVTVTYEVTIFVPFVSRMLADSPTVNVRTVSSTVRIEIEPCLVTQGN